MNDRALHIEKKKNNNAGLSLRTLPFIIGNKNITKVAPVQFIAVAIVTVPGCAISGIYIHTNGPTVNEKLTINNNSPIKIRIEPTSGTELNIANPVPTIAVVRIFNPVPICIKGFLPKNPNNVERISGAITWIPFTIIGKIALRSVKTYPTVYPPYTTTAFIPVNCWKRPKWSAKNIAIGGVLFCT